MYPCKIVPAETISALQVVQSLARVNVRPIAKCETDEQQLLTSTHSLEAALRTPVFSKNESRGASSQPNPKCDLLAVHSEYAAFDVASRRPHLGGKLERRNFQG